MENNSVSPKQDIRPEEKKRDTSKMYFFIIAIAALLATNVYFYIKYRSSGEKVYVLNVEKENLQIEIDRIEAELDNLSDQNIELSEPLKLSEEHARATISELRQKLENKTFDQEDLVKAQTEILKLKNSVAGFKVDVDQLKAENDFLQKKNQLLESKIKESSSEIDHLEKSNSSLKNQVYLASGLKLSNITVNGVSVDRKGRTDTETKAKRVDKLDVVYTIADNDLAKKGLHDIYVRVINPQGNLVISDNNIFYVHGEKLQYTFKEKIDFTNNGGEYNFSWIDPSGFSKGAYTILLYADNAIMGRSSLILK